MDNFRIAFDHLFLLAIAFFCFALFAGVMTARKVENAPYGSLFLGLVAYGAWFQAVLTNQRDRLSTWDLWILGIPIVLSIFLLPLAAARLIGIQKRNGFHWIALLLAVAYLPFFGVMAYQFAGRGGVLGR